MNRRDEVVALALKIVALRSELAETDRELDAVLADRPSHGHSATIPRPTGARRGRPPGGGPSLTQRILDGLKASPDMTFRAGAVAQALGARAKTVTVTLGRLVNAGKVVRIAPGQYKYKP
jgi:hypothetical protein